MSQVETFLNLLAKRTHDKKVLWNETDYEDTYESKFGGTVLRLSPYRTYGARHMLGALAASVARGIGESYKPHVLEIISKDGTVIETIGIKPLFADPNPDISSVVIYGIEDIELDRELAPAIKRLHTAVQRQLDVPSAVISSLIEELEKD